MIAQLLTATEWRLLAVLIVGILVISLFANPPR